MIPFRLQIRFESNSKATLKTHLTINEFQNVLKSSKQQFRIKIKFSTKKKVNTQISLIKIV